MSGPPHFPPTSARYTALPPSLESAADGSSSPASSSGPSIRPRWASGDRAERKLTGKGRLLRVAGVVAALLLVAAAWRSSRSDVSRATLDVEAAAPDMLESEWDVSVDQEVPPTPPAPIADELQVRPPEEPMEELEPPARAATWNLDHCTDERSSCQFLLPGWIGGQESRGQEHLYRLGLLAVALDRIRESFLLLSAPVTRNPAADSRVSAYVSFHPQVVLPNASHSELGVCLPRPYTFYYDATSLASFGVSTVTQAEFSSWLVSRSVPPSGQRIVLQRRGTSTPGTATPPPVVEIGGVVDLTDKAKAQISCMDEFPINYESYESLAMYGLFSDSQEAGDEFVASFVQHIRAVTGFIDTSPPSLDYPATPTVLSIPVIVPWWTTTGGRVGVNLSVIETLNPTALQPSPAFTHLAYAPAWVAATTSIIDKLSPFVAIHWRTERLVLENFAPCTQSLVATLTDLKREYPALTTVYLLTDYPMESLRGHAGEVVPHSASYGRIPKEVSRSMQELLSWFESDQSGLELTTWTQEEDEVEFASVTRELLPLGVRLKDLDLSLVGTSLCFAFLSGWSSTSGLMQACSTRTWP